MPLRVALLCKELFFVVVFVKGTLATHLAAKGIGTTINEEGWLLERNHSKVLLPHLDVTRLFLGFAFAGVSPEETATTIADLFGVQPGRIE